MPARSGMNECMQCRCMQSHILQICLIHRNQWDFTILYVVLSLYCEPKVLLILSFRHFSCIKYIAIVSLSESFITGNLYKPPGPSEFLRPRQQTTTKTFISTSQSPNLLLKEQPKIQPCPLDWGPSFADGGLGLLAHSNVSPLLTMRAPMRLTLLPMHLDSTTRPTRTLGPSLPRDPQVPLSPKCLGLHLLLCRCEVEFRGHTHSRLLFGLEPFLTLLQ